MGNGDQDQHQTRRKRRLLLVVLAALIAIVGALGGFRVSQGHWIFQSGTTSRQPLATLAPIQSLLAIDTSAAETCPTGIAWSPDALKIAVAADGEQSECATSDPGRTQTVIVYDARSGAQLDKFSMYITLQHLKIDANNAYAGQPSWSPDGSMIVVPFDLLDTTGQHSGLLVIPIGHGAPRVLLDTTDTQLVRPIWNIKTGHLVAVQTKALPQALTYTWSADGAIHPQIPPPPAGSTAYTGSPVMRAGDTSFSRWQQGLIAPVLRSGYTSAPFAWFHSDAGAFWSPDGQFVAPNYLLATRVPDPAGASPAALLPQDSTCDEFAAVGGGEASDLSSMTTYCGQPALPYPDAAYAAVVAAARAGFRQQDGSGRSVVAWSPVAVAWRPDGRVLAAMLPADSFATQPSSLRVTLYDTATGKVLATLAQTVMQPSSQTNAPCYLSWSPSGQQLALVNNGDSQVIVWGASSLAVLPPIAQ